MSTIPLAKGWTAYVRGLGFLDNPYDPNSPEGRQWIDGYVDSLIIHRENP